MAEVFHVFDEPVLLDGAAYDAQVVGRPDGHLWEGWVEFIARDGSGAFRTARETTQPDRAALAYWATGLSGTYLEGAFARALNPLSPRAPAHRPTPMFEAPAPNPAGDIFATDRAVLDPFSVGAKGETLLRNELSALRGWHLRNIIRAYNLAPGDAHLEAMTEAELTELIVVSVRSATQDAGV